MARIPRPDMKPRPHKAVNSSATAGGDDEEVESPKTVPVEDDDDYFGGADAPMNPTDEDGEDEVAEEPLTKPKLGKGQKPPAKPSGILLPPARRIIQMGTPRKLTKKQENQQLADWRGKNHGKNVASLVKANVEAARKKFGHRGVFHGSETKDLVIGIPVPALAFEFLIAQDVFPLGLVMQLVAKHGTGKSGLLAEFARWFDNAGGFTTVHENETKFSPEWYESIMGTESFERMQLNRCDSVESWQEHMSFDLQSYKKLLEGTKEKPGPGRTIAWLQGVDSVMGKMSEDSQESIRKEGSASRGFPVEALKISRYMRTVPQWLDGWPFSIVLVNHLKLKKNEDGQEERDKAGGALINFQESFELELKKSGPKKIETQDYEGFQLDIVCEKNSFGPTHRQIRSRVLWWEELDEATGLYKQKTVWDWDWSTVHLLFSIIEGGERNVRLRKRLKEADFDMAFNSPTAASATASSKVLGVSAKEPLLWHEMGALIRERPDVMDRLRKALMIKQRPLLKGDYLSQLQGIAEDLP